MRRLRLGVIFLLFAITVGCDNIQRTGADKRNSPSMNMQRAAEKADVIMLRTLSNISPDVQWNHGPSSDRICDGEKKNSWDAGFVRRRVAVVTIVSEERRGNLLGVVERGWKENGYKITSVDSDRELPAIYAKSSEGFLMSVAVGNEGQFFFSVTTPCVNESAVKDPATEPNTAQREGEYPQPPDIRDDFWSSSDSLPPALPSTS